MQNTAIASKKTGFNNFYTEKLMPGAYVLEGQRIAILKQNYPSQESFIDEMAKALTSDGISIQACLLAHFTVLKNAYDSNVLSAGSEDNMKFSEIKFSYINITEDGTRLRFETVQQQMLRRSFLTFNMRSANRKLVDKTLLKFGLGMVTMGDCSCCITAIDNVEKLESSEYYVKQNLDRSEMNVYAVETLELEPSELYKLDARINNSDITLMHEIVDVLKLFAFVDHKKSV